VVSATPTNGRAGPLLEKESERRVSGDIVLKAGVRYRVTTDSGKVFTGTFNGTWPGSSGDGRSFLDVELGDAASVRVDSMSVYVSEIHSAEPVE
jgi:predicted NUDIX family NTP pyrophosphohydrolase